MIRTLVMSTAGLVVTVALLWWVQRLIAPSPTPDQTGRAVSLIEMVRLERERPPPPPPPAPRPERPPPPPQAPLPSFAPAPPTAMVVPELGLRMPALGPGALVGGGLDIGVGAPATAGVSRRKPRVVHSPRPAYPAIARRRAIEGWVSVELLVDASGAPREIKVIAADPPNIFDRAAISAVRRWRFEPAMAGGKAVTARVAQRIDFQLAR